MWCVANKADGRMRHYDTTQLRLSYNGVLELNKPQAASNGGAVRTENSSGTKL